LIGSGLDFYQLTVPAGAPLPDPNMLKLDRPVMIEQSAEKTADAQSLKNFIRDADQAKYSGFTVGIYSTRTEDEDRSLVDHNGKRRPIADAVKSALTAAQQQIQPSAPPVQRPGG
jgi:hypothetical protein